MQANPNPISKPLPSTVASIKSLFLTGSVPEAFFQEILKILQDFDMTKKRFNPSFMDIYKALINLNPNFLSHEDQIEIRTCILGKFQQLFQTNANAAVSKLVGTPLLEICIAAIPPKSLVTYEYFVVMGCPWSTDIDCLVFCPSRFSEEKLDDLNEEEEKRLVSDLQRLGYDTSRGVDYSLVVVRDNRVINSSKGGSGNANIALRTWRFHKQVMSDSNEIPLAFEKYDVQYLTIESNSSDYFDMLRAISKFIWDNSKYLTKKTEYDIQSLYLLRELVYKGDTSENKVFTITKIRPLLEIVDRWILKMRDPAKNLGEFAPMFGSNKTNAGHWVSCMKSLTMKFIQVIVWDLDGSNETIAYTKEEIAEQSRRIFEAYPRAVRQVFDEKDLQISFTSDSLYSACLYNLSRGTRGGTYNPFLFRYLFGIYLNILSKFGVEVDVAVEVE